MGKILRSSDEQQSHKSKTTITTTKTKTNKQTKKNQGLASGKKNSKNVLMPKFLNEILLNARHFGFLNNLSLFYLYKT